MSRRSVVRWSRWLFAATGSALLIVTLGAGVSTGQDLDVPPPTVDCVDDDGSRRPLVLSFAASDSTSSVVLRTAGRSTIALSFTSSCIIDDSIPEPSIALLPAADGRAPPFPPQPEGISVDGARDGYLVRIPVERDEFGVGRFEARVRVTGDEVVTTTVPVAVTIKSTSWWWATIAVLMGLAAGILAAAFGAWNLNPPPGEEGRPFRGTLGVLRQPFTWIATVVGVALVFAPPGGPFQALYSDVDFWEPSFRRLAELGVAGFGVGAGSTVAVLVGRGVSPRQSTAVHAA